jgi:hypothetical protein
MLTLEKPNATTSRTLSDTQQKPRLLEQMRAAIRPASRMGR